MKTARFLQEQPLSGGVGDHAIEAIVPLLREVKFAAGEVIVREGDDSDSMVVISTGSVEVLKAGPAADNVPGKLNVGLMEMAPQISATPGPLTAR